VVLSNKPRPGKSTEFPLPAFIMHRSGDSNRSDLMAIETIHSAGARSVADLKLHRSSLQGELLFEDAQSGEEFVDSRSDATK
jgi:hypothetical protein